MIRAAQPTRALSPKEDFLTHFAKLRQYGFQVGEHISTEQLHGRVVTRDGPWAGVTWTGATDGIPDIDRLAEELSLEGKPWEWHSLALRVIAGGYTIVI